MVTGPATLTAPCHAAVHARAPADAGLPDSFLVRLPALAGLCGGAGRPMTSHDRPASDRRRAAGAASMPALPRQVRTLGSATRWTTPRGAVRCGGAGPAAVATRFPAATRTVRCGGDVPGECDL